MVESDGELELKGNLRIAFVVRADASVFVISPSWIVSPISIVSP